MKVLCVGLAICDIPLTPVPGNVMDRDACLIQKPTASVGGDAANVAITLRRLGMDTALCGYVGQDGNGDFVCDTLTAEGVDTAPCCATPPSARQSPISSSKTAASATSWFTAISTISSPIRMSPTNC